MFFDSAALYDSHCHLFVADFEVERSKLVSTATAAGVEQILDVGIDLPSSQQAIANAEQYPSVVKAAVGIDPQVAIPQGAEYEPMFEDPNYRDQQFEQLEELITTNYEQIAGLGETGIDDYWLQKLEQENKITGSMRKMSLGVQQDLFTRHLELAKKHGLSLTVHSRGAEQLSVETVTPYAAQGVTGVFHSYTGSYKVATKVLDMGWGLGVNGIATFKNSTDLRVIYRKILGNVSSDWSPLDFYQRGVYFETDAPYLSPEGKRGETNVPANVADIFQQFLALLH